MKKINSIIMAACVAALGFFTSCGDEDPVGPSILVDGGYAIPAEVNKPVSVSAKIEQGDVKIKLITVEFTKADGSLLGGTITINDATTTTPTLDAFNKAAGATLPISYTFTAEGTYNITITATDKDGEVTAKTVVVTVAGEVKPPVDWTKGVNTITAEGTYAYKQEGNKEGTLVVSELTATSVKVQLDGLMPVVLSDAGASYLLKDGTAAQKADVNKNNFLLAKKNKDASIIDASGLTTKIEGAQNVLFVKQ